MLFRSSTPTDPSPATSATATFKLASTVSVDLDAVSNALGVDVNADVLSMSDEDSTSVTDFASTFADDFSTAVADELDLGTSATVTVTCVYRASDPDLYNLLTLDGTTCTARRLDSVRRLSASGLGMTYEVVVSTATDETEIDTEAMSSKFEDAEVSMKVSIGDTDIAVTVAAPEVQSVEGSTPPTSSDVTTAVPATDGSAETTTTATTTAIPTPATDSSQTPEATTATTTAIPTAESSGHDAEVYVLSAKSDSAKKDTQAALVGLSSSLRSC